MTTQRLQKIIAQAGIASRRKAEEIILQGRVKVNGRVVDALGEKAEHQPGQAIDDELTGRQGRVIVGLNLDNRFTAEMSSQTGLEHTLRVNGQAVATSLSEKPAAPMSRVEEGGRRIS